MALPKFECGQVWVNEGGSVFIVVRVTDNRLIPVWIAHSKDLHASMGICYSNWESVEELSKLASFHSFRLLGNLDSLALGKAFKKVLNELST